MPWLFLAVAIASEITATLSLKASAGFSRLGPSIVVIVGYVTAFVFLSFALRSLNVGTSYAVWSGVGIIGSTVGGSLLFGERVTVWSIAGMALIVVGIAIVSLSATTGR